MSVEVRVEATTDQRNPTTTETWQLVGAGALLVAGVFSDGWAHTNVLDELESFITPWHMVIFAGFLACLAVITRASLRRMPGARSVSAAIPDGWSSAAWGIMLFAAGFVGDGVWHTIYGIEADFEALMSPTHLMMLTGGLAVLSAPIASTSRRADVSLAPVLAAATLFMGMVDFFLVWIWPLNTGVVTKGYQSYVSRQLIASQGTLQALGEVVGVGGYVVFAIGIVSPILYLARRWRLPMGSVMLITLVPWAGLTASFLGDEGLVRLPAIVAATLAGELMLRMRLGSDRSTLLLFAAFVPAIWVAGDLFTLQLAYGIGWVPELVAGSVAMSALAGAGMGLLASDPRGH